MSTDIMTTTAPVGMQIEYRGTKRPKIVEVPIPLVSRSLKTGEIVCDPIGTFSMEDGQALLALSGAEGLYRLVGYLTPDGSLPSPVASPGSSAPSASPVACSWCGKQTKSAFGLQAHQRACSPPSPESTQEGIHEPSPDEGRLKEE